MEGKKYGDYITISLVGSGGCGEIFVSKKENDVEPKAYIVKALIGNKRTIRNILALQNEIDSIKKLNIIPRNEHIPFLYASDKYNFPKEKEEKSGNKTVEENNNNIINK